MAKQLNINLAFTADASQAKRELQMLQESLSKISKAPTNLSSPITKQMQEASAAASELQYHLKNATNVKTGNLDFSKLSQSLKASKIDLVEYAHRIKSLGPEGQQAFAQIATAVAKAEIPLKRSSTMLQQMGVVLKNTIRWQLSSQALHSFMGAIQNAYRYTQDLDKSLNNIRIVTGQSTDQMAAFAKQANKAAQALSTTTTNYTDAALIYYQQGALFFRRRFNKRKFRKTLKAL